MYLTFVCRRKTLYKKCESKCVLSHLSYLKKCSKQLNERFFDLPIGFLIEALNFKFPLSKHFIISIQISKGFDIRD